MELQFITHFTEKYSYFDAAHLALEGGCRWIQLRMKEAPEAEVEAEAIRVRDLCRKYGATFIIDDHVALAKSSQQRKNSSMENTRRHDGYWEMRSSSGVQPIRSRM